MKNQNKYIISVFAAGFLTLIILSVLLFWGRKVCQAIIFEDLIVGKEGVIKIQPSGLVPQLDSDPCVVAKSSIEAFIGDGVWFGSFGLLEDLVAERGLDTLGLVSSEIYYTSERIWLSKETSSPIELIYFEKQSGQFVYCDLSSQQTDDDQTEWVKNIRLYAGPKGVSETPDANLGRFVKPLASRWAASPEKFTFYDNSLGSFFQISFTDKKVRQGPKPPDDFLPVSVSQGEYILGELGSLLFRPPYKLPTLEQLRDEAVQKYTRHIDGKSKTVIGAGDFAGHWYAKQRNLLFSDSRGEIRKLDQETLELSGPIAYPPRSLGFGKNDSATQPRDLFAYQAIPVTTGDDYFGTITGAISREGFVIGVSVFGADGRLLNERKSVADPFDKVGGPTLMIITYILENLQPSAFGLASYFTAFGFDARAGHRGLFILPNSFVAIFARESNLSVLGGTFLALLIISPSILLGLALAWRVGKDAALVGLSQRARRYWIAGTILFGLSAYITYRLTKPAIVLVTCVNCGRLRRPDMSNCHRCGSKWLVPELIPPAWRVIDV